MATQDVPNDQERIANDLRALGVRAGGALLVHSSVRSLQSIAGGLETLVGALLTAVGPFGTLLMPCLSHESVSPDSPAFNLRDTRSDVGALSEYFRSMPATTRSIHPTHSVCGVGLLAAELLGSHHLDSTPVGPHSPFRALRLCRGQILMLGCGLGPNTSLHGAEEIVRPPYLFGSEQTFAITVPGRPTWRKTYTTHDFSGWTQRYERIRTVMPPDSIREGRVHGAASYLFDAETLWNSTVSVLTEEPLYFVDTARS